MRWLLGPPLAILLAAGAVLAQEPGSADRPLTSLLFAPEEVRDIQQARRAAAEAADAESPQPDAEGPAVARMPGPRAVHLSGILYSGPQTWRIWLNGELVTPGQRPDYVEQLQVERDGVRIRLEASAERPAALVRLRPNQSYIVATGEVIEGAPSEGAGREGMVSP